MLREIPATFRNGSLALSEDLDLEEGDEVFVIVRLSFEARRKNKELQKRREESEALLEAAGPWTEEDDEWVLDLKRKIYESRARGRDPDPNE